MASSFAFPAASFGAAGSDFAGVAAAVVAATGGDGGGVVGAAATGLAASGCGVAAGLAASVGAAGFALSGAGALVGAGVEGAGCAAGFAGSGGAFLSQPQTATTHKAIVSKAIWNEFIIILRSFSKSGFLSRHCIQGVHFCQHCDRHSARYTENIDGYETGQSPVLNRC